MIKPLKLLLLLTVGSLLVFTGCSTADLYSEKSRQGIIAAKNSSTSEQFIHKVLQAIDPADLYSKKSSLRVKALDVWESTIVRWLTPLTDNRQQFEGRLNLFHQGVEFTYLNGDKKGNIIGFDGQPYEIAGKGKEYKDSSSIALYLGPLQSYFEWHQTLLRKGEHQLLGRKVMNNKPYEVVYVTEGRSENLEDYNQYLVYVNAETHLVEFIEFTMRELMASYKGVIHYRDYQPVQGVLMPYWIGIGDEIVNPSFDHYFEVSSIRFEE